jgi:hypothetical protein
VLAALITVQVALDLHHIAYHACLAHTSTTHHHLVAMLLAPLGCILIMQRKPALVVCLLAPPVLMFQPIAPLVLQDYFKIINV